MKKYLEMTVRGVLYTAFLAPLLVLPSSFIFPFIVPKILFMRSVIEIGLFAYIGLLIINWNEYRPKTTPMNIVFGLFLLSFSLSTFFGVDAYHSFWDNHERMLGLFTVLHYGLYYVFCISVLKEWRDWQWFLRWVLVAGSGVMLVAVYQTQNINFLLNQGSERVSSTLGNAIYVGDYGLFLAFLAFLLAVKEKNAIWRWMDAGMGVLGILGMIFSGTRGSILGMVAGIFAAVLGYIFFLKKEHKVLRYSLMGGVIFLVMAAGLLHLFRHSQFVSDILIINRAVNTSWSDIKSSPRWIAWQIALQGWQEKPVFGWGPNNFFYAFNKYYNPRSLDFGYGETWFDNAHNIIMNTLAVQGTFGLIVYLSIFIIGVLVLVQARRDNRQLDIHITVIGIAYLVAHLVGNITVFENPTSYLYFAMWLAFVNNAANFTKSGVLPTVETAVKIIKERKQDRMLLPVTVGFLGFGAFVFIFIFNIQPARANMKALDTIRLFSQSPILGISSLREALAFPSPHIDDIRSDLGRTGFSLLSSGAAQQLGVERSKELFDTIYSALQKNIDLHPLDIRNQLTLAQLSQTGYAFTKDPSYIYKAEQFLEDAQRLSPKRQQVIYGLAGLKAQVGKNEEAIKLLEQTIIDNPRIGEGYWRLAYMYELAKQPVKAREIIMAAEKNPEVKFSDQDKSVIAQIMTTTVK